MVCVTPAFAADLQRSGKPARQHAFVSCLSRANTLTLYPRASLSFF